MNRSIAFKTWKRHRLQKEVSFCLTRGLKKEAPPMTIAPMLARCPYKRTRRSFATSFTKRRFFAKLQKFLQGMLGLQEELLQEELDDQLMDLSPMAHKKRPPLFIQRFSLK